MSQYLGGPTNAGGGQVFGEYCPCDGEHPKSQPVGEYRDQAILQVYNGGWISCTAGGFRYNQVSGWGVTDLVSMGGVPDCGNGTYRLANYVQMYEGGSWRGAIYYGPSAFMN